VFEPLDYVLLTDDVIEPLRAVLFNPGLLENLNLSNLLSHAFHLNLYES